jgi:MFS family permease
LVRCWPIFTLPQNDRARCRSILGASLGSIPALLVGGWVAARYGLSDVFLLAGLPVVALTILIRLLVAEPKRRGDAGGVTRDALPLRVTLGFIWSQRSLRHFRFTPVVTCAQRRGS